MKITIFYIVFFILTVFSAPALAETVVIVNPHKAVTELSREQVVDIYLGNKQHVSDSSTVIPIDLPADSRTRSDFYQKLVKKSVAQINAYRARLLFTGQTTPPMVLGSSKSVMKTVSENRDAIAYIDSEDLDSSVKVVFRLK